MFENVGISISSTSFEVRHLVRQTSVVRVQFSFLSSHVIIAQMAFRFKFRQTMHAIFSKIFFTVSMHGERSSGRLLPYCSTVRRDFLFIRVLYRAAALPAATCPDDVGEECCIAYFFASTQSAQAGRNSCSCLPRTSPHIFGSFFPCVSLSLSLGDLPKGRVVPNSFRNM